MKPISISKIVFFLQTTLWELPPTKKIISVFLPREGPREMILGNSSRNSRSHTPQVRRGLCSLSPCPEGSSGAAPPQPNVGKTYCLLDASGL